MNYNATCVQLLFRSALIRQYLQDHRSETYLLCVKIASTTRVSRIDVITDGRRVKKIAPCSKRAPPTAAGIRTTLCTLQPQTGRWSWCTCAQRRKGFYCHRICSNNKLSPKYFCPPGCCRCGDVCRESGRRRPAKLSLFVKIER